MHGGEDPDETQREGLSYLKTSITIPHGDHFFDQLTWMYSKDKIRLKKAALETDNLLRMLSLGIFLKMKDDFFNALLESDIHVGLKDFETENWSRTAFTFPVLEKILEVLNLSPEEKIIALLSWLKEDFGAYPYNTDECGRQREMELLTSLDFYLVRNYISGNKLLTFVSSEYLSQVMAEFKKLNGLFDSQTVLKHFGLVGTHKIWCKICKKSFTSAHDITLNPKCEPRLFHPKGYVTSFRQLKNKTKCAHGDCGRNIQRNEYACCHLPSHSPGCIMSEGSHLLIFEN